MVEDTEFLLKKISEIQDKNNRLEYKNQKLQKENEMLNSRVYLITTRPFPRHYRPIETRDNFGKITHCFMERELDCLTLEYIHYELGKKIKKLSDNTLNNVDTVKLMMYTEIREWIWDMMNSDSHDWIKSDYNPLKYYDDDDD